jgi:hypothetical protein
LPERPVCRVLGVDVPLSGGRITLLALDEAFETSAWPPWPARPPPKCARSARRLASRPRLPSTRRQSPPSTPAPGPLRGVRLNEITALLNQVAAARSSARTLADSSVASGYVGDLDTSLGTHADTLTTLSTDYQAWRTANPRDVTLSESAEQRTTEAMGTQQQMLDEGHYGRGGVG